MVPEIKKEIEALVANKETFTSLMEVTFKGLTPDLAKRAILEAMLQGFTIKDFLTKNIYATPFNQRKGDGWEKTYSLVTSVSYARKLGMRNGIVGKSEPQYEMADNKILSCTVTVKRKVGDYVGDYTAKVFFNEYTTGKNLWLSKPHTMIAKVAEMHALRMACPEELSNAFIEEEMEQEAEHTEKLSAPVDTELYEQTLRATKTVDELAKVWVNIPAEAKAKLISLKNELKAKYANATV